MLSSGFGQIGFGLVRDTCDRFLRSLNERPPLTCLATLIGLLFETAWFSFVLSKFELVAKVKFRYFFSSLESTIWFLYKIVKLYLI